jgi:hypothetical protein
MAEWLGIGKDLLIGCVHKHDLGFPCLYIHVSCVPYNESIVHAISIAF